MLHLEGFPRVSCVMQRFWRQVFDPQRMKNVCVRLIGEKCVTLFFPKGFKDRTHKWWRSGSRGIELSGTLLMAEKEELNGQVQISSGRRRFGSGGFVSGPGEGLRAGACRHRRDTREPNFGESAVCLPRGSNRSRLRLHFQGRLSLRSAVPRPMYAGLSRQETGTPPSWKRIHDVCLHHMSVDYLISRSNSSNLTNLKQYISTSHIRTIEWQIAQNEGRTESQFQRVGQRTRVPIDHGARLYRILCHDVDLPVKRLFKQIWFGRIQSQRSGSVIGQVLKCKRDKSLRIFCSFIPFIVFLTNKQPLHESKICLMCKFVLGYFFKIPKCHLN